MRRIPLLPELACAAITLGTPGCLHKEANTGLDPVQYGYSAPYPVTEGEIADVTGKITYCLNMAAHAQETEPAITTVTREGDTYRIFSSTLGHREVIVRNAEFGAGWTKKADLTLTRGFTNRFGESARPTLKMEYFDKEIDRDAIVPASRHMDRTVMHQLWALDTEVCSRNAIPWLDHGDRLMDR